MMILFFAAIAGLSAAGVFLYTKANGLLYSDSLLKIGNMNALSAFYKKLPDRLADKMFMIAFDIDKFKEFNYIYGVEEGDRLLRYISDIIQEEAAGTSVFRYAFDYFILLNAFENQEECEAQVQKILRRFGRDIESGVIPLFEISAGIRKFRPDESLQLVINDALIAREAVKGNVLQHYAVYDEETRSRRLAYMEMESNFPAAIQNREFHVYYQPKYNMITGEIIGAEALVRWIKPDGTIIGPNAFIPCFETSYQISILDEVVLREVCRGMSQMTAEGLHVKPVSVNFSRVHLKHSGFLTKIEEIIQEYNVDPAMLSFEITESAIYEDAIPLKSIVEHLHKIGCQVDMDDYGVGVSGPKSLATYRFDTVKFDKSFVDDIDYTKVADIIRTTSYMVKQWGMKVIAEGVETKAQARQLVGLGCTLAQGFYYSKPVPEDEYRRMLIASPASQTYSERKVSVHANFFSDEVRSLFDSNLLPVYIINPKNFIVVYSNLAMQKALGKDVTGGLCYEKLRGTCEPCKSCTAMRLYRDGDATPKEYLSEVGIWTLLQASPLHWRGREYIQISCMDITRQKQLEEQLRAQSGME